MSYRSKSYFEPEPAKPEPKLTVADFFNKLDPEQQLVILEGANYALGFDEFLEAIDYADEYAKPLHQKLNEFLRR